MALPAVAGAKHDPFVTTLKHPTKIGSTVPSNGDVNPYGIAVVPQTVGALVAGDTLVSNFNDKANVQGTGSTIVEVSPSGKLTEFAHVTSSSASGTCPGGIGLTTALSILPGGWVVVGSLPAGTKGALPDANPAGCLVVLNSSGTPVETWTSPDINGPWDMTAHVSGSTAQLFVANALSRPSNLTSTPPTGLCTVIRIEVSMPSNGQPMMTGAKVIGTGFPWAANKTAFVQSPTGLALGHHGTLYVAETIGSSITAIPDALTRTDAVKQSKKATLTSKGFLNGPLGLVMAPNGDLIAANGNDGNVVEVSPQGHQVAKLTLVHDGAGDLFGLTIAPGSHNLLYVNDGTNAVDVAATHTH